LRDNRSLAIVGKADSIGAWDVFKAVPMCEHNYNEWIVDIDASTLKENKLEFKFAAIDNDDDTNTLWEAGFNREIDLKILLMEMLCVLS
jgi:4-alpha-glucanotransferase